MLTTSCRLFDIDQIIDSVFEAVFLLKRFGALKRVYDDMQLADLHAFLFQEKVLRGSAGLLISLDETGSRPIQ